MHLRQPGFRYSAFGPFTEGKKTTTTTTTKKFKEAWDFRYIYQNELDKACFQHGMAYGDFKDCLKHQLLIKYYVVKLLILLKINNIMNIKEVLFQWFIIFLIVF